MFLKKEGEDYVSNFFRSKLYDKDKKMYLVTVDDGNFLFLNKSAFRQLKCGNIEDEDLFLKLVAKGIIVTDENFNLIVDRMGKRYSFLDNGTSLHIVIPTSRCNLGCKYCFAEPDSIGAPKEKYDLDEKTAKKIVEFIMSSPSRAITIEFQGGEATARFDLVKIMTNYAKELNEKYKKNLKLAIVSNLTLMNDEMAQWFVDNDVTVCTSLDGPKVVHDKNRIILAKEGVEIGTYERVVYWIKRINAICEEKKKKWRVNALMTNTKHSLPYYKEIIDEYVSLGISLVDIRGLTYVGKAVRNEDNLSYSFDDFVDFYKKSLKYIQERQTKGVRIDDRMKRLYKTKILENKPTYHTDYESPCGAATGQITYHSNGDIYTCHEALGRDEFKLGNVFADDWKSVFKKSEVSKGILNSMLEANPICDRCVFKPYCGTCMVENFYHFGKFNFYPTKTGRHHETVMHCKEMFDGILKEVEERI